ncbi:MAG TPA: metal-dependent hydrolase, partial [Rhodospirillaceae bacterium]|nr:metal-dependent hydrolase [Rhodospirillaceae bacterium]
ATKDGVAIAGSRTDMFTQAVSVPVHLPLSGKTMAFDGGGMCTEGC